MQPNVGRTLGESHQRPFVESPIPQSGIRFPSYSSSRQYPYPSLAERQGAPTYYPSREVDSESPIEKPMSVGESLRSGTSGSSAPSPAQLSSALLMHNPKRAYRQRRKDPSCDACRERKVKCDASETSSCTECSSRNVRCQFTKDTNRRMSSIKQVQDLERQLAEARQQLDRVRAREVQADTYGYASPDGTSLSPTDIPAIGKSPRRMLKARSPQDLTQARQNIADFGRGLIKRPVTSGNAIPSRISQEPELPQLPPRAFADQCLHFYFECFQKQWPVLHWTTFHQQVINLYENPEVKPPAHLLALVFAALACGALATRDPNRMQEAQDLLTRAVSTINFWEDEMTTNQAVVGFLASIFLFEINRKSASWIWFGSAVRIGQILGLHVQGGEWSAVEGEMRKRIWYSIYVWDRFLSTELGKPMLIGDDDNDTEYPDVLDEERASMNSPSPTTSLPPSVMLLANIHVSRLLAQLSKLFRSLCITSDRLTTFEAHFGSCLKLLPPTLHLSSSGPLDTRTSLPLIHFQNSRIMLYRHNLSPACSPEQRFQAVEQCVSAARDSASIISRCLIAQGRPQEMEQRMILGATSMFCTHVWRCLLFLLFKPLDEAFFILLRACEIIGTTKPINICSGRHLHFCLRKLIERVEQSPLTSGEIEHDEEIIVYLSGDLQASTNSWVWGNAETGTHLSRRQKHGRAKQSGNESDHVSPPSSQTPPWDGILSEEEQFDWGGWPNVERGARYLQSLTAKRSVQHGQGDQLTPSSGLLHLSGRPSPAQSTPPRPPTTSADSSDGGRSRMTIASII